MSFWRFARMEASGDTPAANALYIDGEMCGDVPWYMEGLGICCPKAFRDAMDALPPGDLNVYVNSPGGNVDCGVAMYTALRQCKRKVTGIVTGIAYSAATLPLCGCDRVLMSPAATIMVHDPAVLPNGELTAEDCRELEGYLETLHKAVLAAYAERTGRTEAELSAEMRGTHFMTAQEAIDGGWADALLDKPDDVRGAMRAGARAVMLDAAGRLLTTMRERADADELAEAKRLAEAILAQAGN